MTMKKKDFKGKGAQIKGRVSGIHYRGVDVPAEVTIQLGPDSCTDQKMAFKIMIAEEFAHYLFGEEGVTVIVVPNGK